MPRRDASLLEHEGREIGGRIHPHLLGSIMMIVLLSTLVPGTRGQSLSYTEFKHKVQANEVADVVINDVRIRGTFRKDDQPFDAIRIDDPSLVGELERHGVNVRGELATDWWSTLGIWLLPLLFIVFWTQSLRERPDREPRSRLAEATPRSTPKPTSR